MSLKSKILIIVILLLVFFVISIRVIFYYKLGEFKYRLAGYEKELIIKFQTEKTDRLSYLKEKDKELAQLLSSQFDNNLAVTLRDTTFRYVYLNKTIQYNRPSLQYIDCLANKCLIVLENRKNAEKILQQKERLQKKYGDDFKSWYHKIDSNIITPMEPRLIGCSGFFKKVYLRVYNKPTWDALDEFLRTFRRERWLVKKANLKVQKDFDRLNRTIKSKLKSSIIGYFNDQLDRRSSEITKMSMTKKVFSNEILGEITYGFTLVEFNQKAYDLILNDAMKEQWRSNSLYTGAKPYSDCYGSYNSCDYYGCSAIKIDNGGTDAIVLVKNNSGRVVRHAYIKSNKTYTFEVSDGSYKVFFYSGEGWNPTKVITKAPCRLTGGFEFYENVTKDNYVTLKDNILTYQLKSVNYGNFRPKTSTMKEAFQ